MRSKQMTRREAAAKLAALTAAAVGLDAAEVDRLVGQIRRATVSPKLNLETLAKIRPTTSVGKFLKVIVIAREDIFVSEFGRDAIFGKTAGLEGGVCPVFVNFGGGINDINDCSDNKCGTQDCPELFCSGTNSCGKQTCGKQRMPANSDLFAPANLERIRNDIFVQALFKEFNVATTKELSMKLIEMVSQRRSMMIR